MRPGGDRVRLRLAKPERGLELAVFLGDRLGLDHPLEHRLAVALELAVLARRVPIIACAVATRPVAVDYFMERRCDRAGDVERGAANALESARCDQRNGEQDEADQMSRQ